MITVLSNKDLVKHLETGETPVPPEVAADNARAAAAAEKANGKPAAVAEVKETKEAVKEKEAGPDPDDIEGEDGLTPRQKREYTAAMLKSIGKKHREKIEAEEFAAAQYNDRRLAEQRAEELEKQLAEYRAKSAPAKKADAEPVRENFQTEAEYANALIDWRVDQKLKAKEAETAEKREQQIQESCQKSLERAQELVPDYEEVTGSAELVIPGHIAHVMRHSPLFAELGYHFAKHPEDLAKLAITTPNKFELEFRKIEGKLQPFSSSTAAKTDEKVKASETESAPQTAANGKGADPSPKTESGRQAAGPSQTRAPVITPINAGSAAQVETAPEKMNTREVIEAWQKQNQRDLNRRRRH